MVKQRIQSVHQPKRVSSTTKNKSCPDPDCQRRTDLFVRVCGGEEHLFGPLAIELGEMLRRRLGADSRTRVLCENPVDEEDVVQETLLRLWSHRARYDATRGQLDFYAWVICRNLAINALRLRYRTKLGNSALEAIADRRVSEPCIALIVAEEREIFEKALARVPNRKARRVLKLRFLDGLPYAKVSAKTGLPKGTVGTLVYRFRQSLKTL